MKRLMLPLGFVCAAIVVGCSSSTTTSDKQYELKGTVVAVNADKKKIKIDHQEIPGLMAAMTMTFDLADAKIVDGLAEGDGVEGKLKVVDGKRIVTELHKTASGSAAIPKKELDDEAEISANIAKLPDLDRKAAEAQRVCPVTKERLGSMDAPVKIVVKGKTVFLCCASCKKPAEKDPDDTLKKVAALAKK